MTPVFADSSYYVALMSVQDADHSSALHLSMNSPSSTITTEFVLLEVANGFCDSHRRGAFNSLMRVLALDLNAVIVPASAELFRAGVGLYLNRPDKDWSLTDCISFVVMKERGLTDALTTDHHFEQAGFKALLK